MPTKKKASEHTILESTDVTGIMKTVSENNGVNDDTETAVENTENDTMDTAPETVIVPLDTFTSESPPEGTAISTGEKKSTASTRKRKKTDEPPEEGEHEPAVSDLPPEAITDVSLMENDTGQAERRKEEPASKPATAKKQPASRKKTLYDLNLNELDRNLSAEEKQEWSAIYASYRSKSILSGTVIGVDENAFDVKNKSTKKTERKTLLSLIIIGYRVKILIPESEIWAPDEEQPNHVVRNMVGSKIDYVVIEVDREGECAIGSRRMALSSRRYYFSTARNGHAEGDRLKCSILAVGAKRCLVECNGYDIQLSQRDLTYTSIADLREKYRPGEELDCLLKSYDAETNRLLISVKALSPNPFVDADKRHPIGSRRHAVISGKYAGGVFCTLPDETTCLCLYSIRHEDVNFNIGDSVIIVIRQYDYTRQLIYGQILAKW